MMYEEGQCPKCGGELFGSDIHDEDDARASSSMVYQCPDCGWVDLIGLQQQQVNRSQFWDMLEAEEALDALDLEDDDLDDDDF